VDLDDFKPINDQFGHAAGDAVLVACGRRMAEQLREVDLVARLGGDEFAVLLADTSDEIVGLVAERLVDAVREPIDLAGGRVRVGCSIGTSLDRGGRWDAHELLKRADEAMYDAKARNKAGNG
jgi:diguanylate cyclase (GGDEF)-like protein